PDLCVGRRAVLGQAALREVQLVGAVDQLDDAVDMVLDVVLDFNADVARAQKLDIAAAGRDLVGFALLEKLVLLQAGQGAVGLSLYQRVRQQLGDDRLVGDLQARHKEQRLIAVHRVVVDQQDGFWAELNRLDQCLQPGPFRLPVDARKDEIVPDLMFIQEVAHRLEIVLRADRADDAALGQRNDDIAVLRAEGDAAFAEGPLPEGLVEIPDDEPDRLWGEP